MNGHGFPHACPIWGAMFPPLSQNKLRVPTGVPYSGAALVRYESPPIRFVPLQPRQGTFSPLDTFHWLEAEQGRGCGADAHLEPEAQLVAQCLRGDGAAWEELVRRHSRRIFNLCYRFTNQRQEAEDISQEVFLRVYRTLGSYQSSQGAFGTWVTSVTRNLLIDHYRRTRRDRLTDSMEDVITQVETAESSAARPDHTAAVAELGAHLQRALGKLSPELREAVILRDLEGLDYKEIQQVLGVPEGTVKSRINRGRIELARALEAMGVRHH
jgi:RNA polymerase sigma-70 factor, ECF subfamily